MKNKKIEQIRELATGNKAFTPDEIEWLKKQQFNPANEKCLILAPEYTPDGPVNITEHDREIAQRIKAKTPGMVIIELSKYDTQL